MSTPSTPSTPSTEDRIEAVAMAIGRAQRYDSAPRDTARLVVEALDELRIVRHVENLPAAVAVTERVIADYLGGEVVPPAVRVTAEAVIRRLFDDPVLSIVRDDDGTERVTISWPADEVRACLASRESIDRVVETLNAKTLVIAERDHELAEAFGRIRTLEREVATLRAQRAATVDALDMLTGDGTGTPTGLKADATTGLGVFASLSMGPWPAGAPQTAPDAVPSPTTPPEAPQEPQDPAEAPDGPVSPDCLGKKHPGCSGDAWDLARDRLAACACLCHIRAAR